MWQLADLLGYYSYLKFIRATRRGVDVQSLLLANKELSRPQKPLLSAYSAKGAHGRKQFLEGPSQYLKSFLCPS